MFRLTRRLTALPRPFLSLPPLPRTIIRTLATKRIFVGNVPQTATTEDVTSLLSKHGTVTDAWLFINKLTGKHRQCGFFDMEAAEAIVAIEQVDGKELHGRLLRVAEATEREPAGSADAEQVVHRSTNNNRFQRRPRGPRRDRDEGGL
ncbi:uncharacterized protein EV422DRAFT_266812 [Fimicolochytrium jonesii]|uniref:uncharacterized protein n=1 Tax=Fimicolochytrium jonesii TaxID=1396493 RepID=UPI0022FF0198|nr:uncharacterized protein EV422DRAFT_266812 [Fimicolochytrium jonesii]KAI8816946.1 hypothetical protein EV422DRAFT_266812 [Fimicolochytrium jonesii]